MSTSPGYSIVEWADPARRHAFYTWLGSLGKRFGIDGASVRLASADASFRRYLRVDSPSGSRIIMDAPPDKENSQSFVAVARLMAIAGLNAPAVLDWDEANGFMLLSDLGDQTMMAAINPENPADSLPLYLQAVDALVAWQRSSRPGVLPPYDDTLLRRELELFPEWYLQRHKNIDVTDDLRQTLDGMFQLIVERNLAWPCVFVHRDFMPRNLMKRDGLPLGILDFQDAVYGPVTYDIASLMRDAFLSWEEDFVLDVTIRYWDKARRAGLPVGDDFGEFYKGVEWMGLQRHIKIAGIFARLTLRDGKPKYLADAPRFIRYIHATASRYIELRPLQRLVEQIEGMQTIAGYAYGRI